MATKLQKAKSKLYSNNPESMYLALSDEELLEELYDREKIKQQYKSFNDFKTDYTVDVDGKFTDLQKETSPYNYPFVQKAVKPITDSVNILTSLYPDSVRRNIFAAPVEVAQGTAEFLGDIGLRKVIPEPIRKGAADFSTYATQAIVGEEGLELQSEQKDGVKIGKPVRPDSFGGELIKEGTEFGIGLYTGTTWFNAFKRIRDASKIKKIQKEFPDARVKSLLPGGGFTKTKAIAKGVTIGELASQATMDPETAAVGEFIGKYVGDDAGALSTLLEYMTADKSKTDLENRLALLLDGLFITGAVGGVIAGGIKFGPKLYKSGKELFNKFKSVKETGTPAEKEQFIKVIEDTAEANPKTETPSELRGPESDDVLKLWQFSDNPIQRGVSALWGTFFRSEGTNTPKMFKILNLNKNAQIAWAAKGEQLMTRINSQIELIAKEQGQSKEAVEELFDGFLFGNKSIDTLAKSIRPMAQEARDSIDELSTMIGQSKGIDPELKLAIQENLGTYLRTTYKRFEDPNYKPSQQHVDEAVAYIHRQYIKQSQTAGNSRSGLTSEELLKQAEAQVEVILREAKYSDDLFQFLNTVSGGPNSKVIFKEKRKIADEIKNLLGVETNTGSRIFSTLNTLSDFVYKHNTFQKFYNLGKDKYFFDNPTGQFSYQIKGKQFGPLDGKWTTDAMALNFIGGPSSRVNQLADKTLIPQTIKLLYTAKGFGQGSKTVLNNVTHERNFQSSSIIMLSNGLNPLSTKSWDAAEIAWNNVRKGGDEALDNLYNRYLRLGIVNQNAKIGDIRQLLKSASKTGVAGYANKVLDFSVGGQSLRGTYKGIERLYVAEDDIWKIAVFEKELATLKKAFPTMSDDILEQQAAQITRDVMPTYDMIPAGFRALRYSPWGNYFSFHAERFRNTVKTYKQGYKEINSDSEIIRQRGWQRLGAKVVVGARGGAIVGSGSMAISGVSTEEDKHIKNIMQEDYHGDNWIYDTQEKTGDLTFVDTKFIDPDAPVNDATLNLLLRQISTGDVTEEELDSVLNKFFINSMVAISAPFFDENLLGSVFIDTIARNGKDKDGFDIPGYTTTKNKTLDSRIQNISAITRHAWNTALKPAVIDNVEGIVRAADPQADKYGVKPDMQLEGYRNLTGFNWKPVNKENIFKALNNKLYDFKSEKRLAEKVMLNNYDSTRTPITVDDLYNNFLQANKQYYIQYVKTKKLVDSIQQLGYIDEDRAKKGTPKRYNISDIDFMNNISFDTLEKSLKDAGISEEIRNQLNSGRYSRDRFVPIVPSTEQLELFYKMHPDVKSKDVEETLKDLTDMLRQLPLLELRDNYTQASREALELIKSGRVPNASGGLIEGEFLVPYTKEDPADRIDPLTGEPYNREQRNIGGLLLRQLSKRGAARGTQEVVDEPIQTTKPLKPAEIPLLPLKYTQKKLLADENFKGFPAYHGTAHNFDEFTTDFLKSGEGVMAYGKGLYFAESKDIAKTYRTNVSKIKGLEKLNMEYKALIDEAEKAYKAGDNIRRQQLLLKAIDKDKELDKFKNTKISKKAGSLYDVNIKTTKTHLLNWDKKMQSQSSGVITAAEIALERLTTEQLEKFINRFSRYPSFTRDSMAMERAQLLSDAKVALQDITGDEFVNAYNKIVNNIPIRVVASRSEVDKTLNPNRIFVEDTLKDEGVQGIKYNDGFSRKKDGKKTKNYVIFDARIIEIAKKYGIPIPAAGNLLMEMDNSNLSEEDAVSRLGFNEGTFAGTVKDTIKEAYNKSAAFVDGLTRQNDPNFNSFQNDILSYHYNRMVNENPEYAEKVNLDLYKKRMQELEQNTRNIESSNRNAPKGGNLRGSSAAGYHQFLEGSLPVAYNRTLKRLPEDKRNLFTPIPKDNDASQLSSDTQTLLFYGNILEAKGSDKYLVPYLLGGDQQAGKDAYLYKHHTLSSKNPKFNQETIDRVNKLWTIHD